MHGLASGLVPGRSDLLARRYVPHDRTDGSWPRLRGDAPCHRGERLRGARFLLLRRCRATAGQQGLYAELADVASWQGGDLRDAAGCVRAGDDPSRRGRGRRRRSEEHTSELQSRQYLVCRLLLEKKKKKKRSKRPISRKPLSSI